MMAELRKFARFGWRVTRNLVCILPAGRRWLFPPQTLSQRFGRGDAEYAVDVFRHHYRQLSDSGFSAARQILEVGPGRNLGTALMMWVLNEARLGRGVAVTLWDVFPNMQVSDTTMRAAAQTLLQLDSLAAVATEVGERGFLTSVQAIAAGDVVPDIRYRVCPLSEFVAKAGSGRFDLVYSQAAIEHVWDIANFWTTLVQMTREGGWHSHRIDLADHGKRETNYIEMLEWSPIAYWLTMRFVPGAINRWRASMHQAFISQLGMAIRHVQCQVREQLPIPQARIHSAFRQLAEIDLRTTAMDLVAIKRVD